MRDEEKNALHCHLLMLGGGSRNWINNCRATGEGAGSGSKKCDQPPSPNEQAGVRYEHAMSQYTAT